MKEDTRKLSDEFERIAKAALDDDSIPTLYFNGFINVIGMGDVLIVLQRHGKTIAKLHASHTVAKTLAEKLGGSIANLEGDTGNTIMTTDVINQAIARSRDKDNGMGR